MKCKQIYSRFNSWVKILGLNFLAGLGRVRVGLSSAQPIFYGMSPTHADPYSRRTTVPTAEKIADFVILKKSRLFKLFFFFWDLFWEKKII